MEQIEIKPTIWLEASLKNVGSEVFELKNAPIIEGFTDKVARHLLELLTERSDSAAILRGLAQARNILIAKALGDLTSDFSYESDYLEIEGLGLAKYRPKDPMKKRFLPKAGIRVYEFPASSHITIAVTDTNQQPIHTRNFLDQNKEAIAAITGPTFFENQGLPNNGFYYSDVGVLTPFQDTERKGERRGAFVINDKGDLVVIDDLLKWKVVEQDFNGVRAMIGTANYLTSFDTGRVQRDGFSQISYLLQYFKPGQTEESVTTCFAISTHDTTRSTMRSTLNDFVKRCGGAAYIAVELERNKGEIILRSNRGMRRLIYDGTGGFGTRYDHYLVTC